MIDLADAIIEYVEQKIAYEMACLVVGPDGQCDAPSKAIRRALEQAEKNLRILATVGAIGLET